MLIILFTYLLTFYWLDCVSFGNPEKTVSEDERLVFLQVCVEKPAANDLIIPVVSSDITAKGEVP